VRAHIGVAVVVTVRVDAVGKMPTAELQKEMAGSWWPIRHRIRLLWAHSARTALMFTAATATAVRIVAVCIASSERQKRIEQIAWGQDRQDAMGVGKPGKTTCGDSGARVMWAVHIVACPCGPTPWLLHAATGNLCQEALPRLVVRAHTLFSSLAGDAVSLELDG